MGRDWRYTLFGMGLRSSRGMMIRGEKEKLDVGRSLTQARYAVRKRQGEGELLQVQQSGA